MDKLVQPLIAAAHAGGKMLEKYFGNHVDIKIKSMAADFQTTADLASEQAVVEVLQQAFPDYNLFAEEQGRIDRGSEYTLVVDPLDGTNNFVLGIPYFSVSIALMKRSTIIAAAVHHPIRGRTYHAVSGGGAFLNGKKISVNQQSDLKHSTLAYIANYGSTPEVECDFVRPFFAAGIKRLLTLWSPALEFGLLAEGKIEAVVCNGCEFYDYAAGKLIAREAGARITVLNGEPEPNDENKFFIASNGTAMHGQLAKILAPSL